MRNTLRLVEDEQTGGNVTGTCKLTNVARFAPLLPVPFARTYRRLDAIVFHLVPFACAHPFDFVADLIEQGVLALFGHRARVKAKAKAPCPATKCKAWRRSFLSILLGLTCLFSVWGVCVHSNHCHTSHACNLLSARNRPPDVITFFAKNRKIKTSFKIYNK